MPAPTNPTWFLLKTFAAIIFALVSAWAVNVNEDVRRHEQEIRQTDLHYRLIRAEMEMLLRAHGMEPVKSLEGVNAK